LPLQSRGEKVRGARCAAITYLTDAPFLLQRWRLSAKTHKTALTSIPIEYGSAWRVDAPLPKHLSKPFAGGSKLEHLEATGAATPESSEMLVELHELLDRLYTMMLERTRQTLQ
jgi:hypothetical protein